MRIFYGGLARSPRLDHPECVAVQPGDGSVWCGGEAGQLYRIAPDGSSCEQVASTGGFVLGIAFSPGGELVVRLTPSRALWYGGLTFPNGLASDGRALYVAESFLPGISRIEILPDGSAGARELVVELPGVVPDGLAFGPGGLLHIACYEPSQVLRLRDGRAEVVAHDPTAHLLCHPTNIAFSGSTAYVANLGRWHITEL
ncbi:SMP-30/gluconolactonase/LRE family protein [Nonomuraea soli]|uniref:Sugar lactone lactonase YvrE n=1 Tax=Nonomuraea soli TaxID=1032476 RepID=A0A7W0CJ26_9ACTN|nr:SMP-30/gluconolactonase/LRE family protein [Nonomuraea soli]MBA2892144.1 sugar lactone lactonase YvrE [Nonomuraea soli]